MARPNWPVGATPRSFLLTVHEPDSAVLEDLRTGLRVHVTELADLGSQVASWLLVANDGEPRPRRPPASARDAAATGR